MLISFRKTRRRQDCQQNLYLQRWSTIEKMKNIHKRIIRWKESRKNNYFYSINVFKSYKQRIHLDIDLLFINAVAFFLATSRHVSLIHCQAVLSKHNKSIANTLLQNTVKEYEKCGFKVITIFAGDPVFNALKPWVKDKLDNYV